MDVLHLGAIQESSERESFLHLSLNGVAELGPVAPSSDRSISGVSRSSRSSMNTFDVSGASPVKETISAPRRQDNSMVHVDTWNEGVPFLLAKRTTSTSLGHAPSPAVQAALAAAADEMGRSAKVGMPISEASGHTSPLCRSGGSTPSLQQPSARSSTLAHMHREAGMLAALPVPRKPPTRREVDTQAELERSRRENHMLSDQLRQRETQLLEAFERINELTRDRDELRDAMSKLDEVLTLDQADIGPAWLEIPQDL